jgi:hypothetical protein
MRVSPFFRILPALLGLMAVPILGCHRENAADRAPDVHVAMAFRPTPPKVGPNTAVVQLTGADNKPVRGAAVKLEGNMNHAGMTPVFADATEDAPGHYRARLEFTMGGDWFVLVNATLADGRTVRRTVDVPGVQTR